MKKDEVISAIVLRGEYERGEDMYFFKTKYNLKISSSEDVTVTKILRKNFGREEMSKIEKKRRENLRIPSTTILQRRYKQEIKEKRSVLKDKIDDLLDRLSSEGYEKETVEKINFLSVQLQAVETEIKLKQIV